MNWRTFLVWTWWVGCVGTVGKVPARGRVLPDRHERRPPGRPPVDICCWTCWRLELFWCRADSCREEENITILVFFNWCDTEKKEVKILRTTFTFNVTSNLFISQLWTKHLVWIFISVSAAFSLFNICCSRILCVFFSFSIVDYCHPQWSQELSGQLCFFSYFFNLIPPCERKTGFSIQNYLITCWKYDGLYILCC